MQVRSVASPTGGDAVRKNGHDLFKVALSKGAIGIRAAEYVEQLLLEPIIGSAHSNNLLGQHVKRSFRNHERVEFSRFDGAHKCCAFDQFVARCGEDAAFGNGSAPVSGAADALQHHGNRARRADVADKVDVSDVNTEFQRSRGHQSL